MDRTFNDIHEQFSSGLEGEFDKLPGRFASIPCNYKQWCAFVVLFGIFRPAFAVLQELATSTEPAGALRKILDASVSDAERQSKPEAYRASLNGNFRTLKSRYCTK